MAYNVKLKVGKKENALGDVLPAAHKREERGESKGAQRGRDNLGNGMVLCSCISLSASWPVHITIAESMRSSRGAALLRPTQDPRPLTY